MKIQVLRKVATRFVLAGGSGVIMGILSFNILESWGVVGSVANIAGYALGACVNFAIQWRMRDYHAR